MNGTYTNSQFRIMKKIVIILSVLLLAVGGVFAARCAFMNRDSDSSGSLSYGSDTISGNNIVLDGFRDDSVNIINADSFGRTDMVSKSGLTASISPAGFLSTGFFAAEAAENGEALELYSGNPQANKRFQVENMLPGDVVTQDFSVKVYHNADITLYFQETVTDEFKNLGQVLRIKVIDSDSEEVICDDFFNMAEGVDYAKTLKASSQGYSVVNYRIEVSVDTSVGNEYQGAELTADFKWYVNEEDQGGLTPPIQTGQRPLTALWVILGVALVVFVTLVIIKRRKEDR